MAFEFFRRRKRLVLMLMVILMVSFLVGGTLLDFIVKPSSKNPIVGTIRGGQIRSTELIQANNDVELLQHIGLADEPFVFMLLANGQRASETYMLLEAEARQSGISIPIAEVDSFFASRGISGKQMDALVSQLRQYSPDITTDQVRGALARWMMVRRVFLNSLDEVPQSQTFLMRLFDDLNEEINLRLVHFTAESQLDKAGNVEPAAILEQFNRYRQTQPRQYTKENPFGFGYYQPDRVNVEYLFLNQLALQRALQPTPQDIQDHYIAHRDQYTVQVPVTAPAGGSAASQPGSQPTTQQFRTEPMTFSQARPRIQQELSNEMTQRAMNDAAGQAANLLAENIGRAAQSQPTSQMANPYEFVVQNMLAPAGELLARPVSLTVKDVPLRDVITSLSQASGVGVAFPYDQGGQYQLSGDVHVSLKGDAKTLGEALAQIQSQLPDLPGQLQWVRLSTIPNAIFASGPVQLLPLQAGQTGLSSHSELAANELIVAAVTEATAQGKPMISVVFGAKAFNPEGTMETGAEGSTMNVVGQASGRLMWRLAAVQLAHAPAAVDSADQLPGLIAKQVETDLKLAHAFDLARQDAEGFLAKVKDDDLAKAAEKAKLQASQTDFFPRKTVAYPRQQLLYAYQQDPQRAMLMSMLVPAGRV